MWEDLGIQTSARICLVNYRISAWTQLRYFAYIVVVGCWRANLLSFHRTRLYAGISLVFAGDEGQLVVADIGVKSFAYRVVTDYVPNCTAERCSFFRRFGQFLVSPKGIVLVGYWNAILEPKIDGAGWGASGSKRCESSLINLKAEHTLVDRFPHGSLSF